MARMQRTVTKAEWEHIKSMRAAKSTGYALHTTKEGLYYFWPMGLQPENPITGKTPTVAARNFLKEYLPRDKEAWNSDMTPPRKRRLSSATSVSRTR